MTSIRISYKTVISLSLLNSLSTIICIINRQHSVAQRSVLSRLSLGRGRICVQLSKPVVTTRQADETISAIDSGADARVHLIENSALVYRFNLKWCCFYFHQRKQHSKGQFLKILHVELFLNQGCVKIVTSLLQCLSYEGWLPAPCF